MSVLTEHGCQIAPRTFYAWVSRAPSKRALSDLAFTGVLAGFYEPDEHGKRRPECLYGSVKTTGEVHYSVRNYLGVHETLTSFLPGAPVKLVRRRFKGHPG